MQEYVKRAYNDAKAFLGQGNLASYVPTLSEADPSKLAVVVTAFDGTSYKEGDSDFRFTMQSIVKVILLAVALRDSGFGWVFDRVGMEPSGDPFNSIVRLETIDGNKPLNPMINAGAISVTSCIKGENAQQRFSSLLTYARELLGNPSLTWNEETYRSEMQTGDKNRALAYMMRSSGVLKGDVNQHLELYFRACSLWVNCEEISFLGAILASGGISPATKKQLIDPFHVKVICSLMTTCGLYDASGEYALRVGIPSKSGVGGGIMGAVIGQMGVGVFSPALDDHGNSVCGQRAMECLSNDLQLSLFAAKSTRQKDGDQCVLRVF